MDDEVRIHQNGRVTDVYRLLYAYEVRGDSIFTRPVVRAQDVIGIWTRFDRGRFEVDRGRLTITYPWFGPADESITVTTVFFRQGCLDGMPMACM
jgi:hypothetical protein